MLQRIVQSAAGAILLLVGAQVSAHDLMTLDDFAAAIGWDFEGTEIRTEKVGDTLYVLFGVGGNIAVSVGDDGVLIVDDQFPQMMSRIKAAIAELGGADIDFAINTHWHFDHADGNLTLGPEGTWIVSHSNARAMNMDDHVINLVSMQYGQKAYPAAALPDITFDDRMQFHFNGERIDLVHFGPAHTTGDTGVFFRGNNAVHLGDVFNGAYPFIDADNGGGHGRHNQQADVLVGVPIAGVRAPSQLDQATSIHDDDRQESRHMDRDLEEDARHIDRE